LSFVLSKLYADPAKRIALVRGPSPGKWLSAPVDKAPGALSCAKDGPCSARRGIPRLTVTAMLG
jgi:hypothetical protein